VTRGRYPDPAVGGTWGYARSACWRWCFTGGPESPTKIPGIHEEGGTNYPERIPGNSPARWVGWMGGVAWILPVISPLRSDVTCHGQETIYTNRVKLV
jgi:hypothetical protein